MSDEATTCPHRWAWGFEGMPMESWFGHESAAFLRSPRRKLRHCPACRQTERFNPSAGRWGEWERIAAGPTETPQSGCTAQDFPRAS